MSTFHITIIRWIQVLFTLWMVRTSHKCIIKFSFKQEKCSQVHPSIASSLTDAPVELVRPHTLSRFWSVFNIFLSKQRFLNLINDSEFPFQSGRKRMKTAKVIKFQSWPPKDLANFSCLVRFDFTMGQLVILVLTKVPTSKKDYLFVIQIWKRENKNWKSY